MVPEGVANFE
jgi:hypothetical protein